MTDTTGGMGRESTALLALRDFPPFESVGIAMQAVLHDGVGEVVTYSIPLSARAGQDLAEIAEQSRSATLEQTPLAYGPAVLIPPDHVMHVDEDQAASLSLIADRVRIGDSPPITELEDRQKIKLLAIRFTAQSGQQIIFFRIADSLSQLKSSRFLALVRSDGVYDRLDPADVMLLRRTFDVAFVEGTAFFTHKSSFERAFGFLDQLRATSAATFDQVTSHLRIHGIEQMRVACTKQSQMMAKMASIRRSMDDDPEYAEAMTMDRLVAFVREREYIDVEIITENGQPALVYQDDVRHRFQILKLLDDDYLHSVLTERDYESGSKILPLS